MKAIYEATVISHGGRDGTVKSTDNLLNLRVNKPKALGGTGDGTNPEELFAAGYSACFHSALLSVAKSLKIDVSGSEVEIKVGIGKADSGEGFSLAVDIAVDLPGINEEQAQKLMDKAHELCPYSRATRGNIPVNLSLKPQTTAP